MGEELKICQINLFNIILLCHETIYKELFKMSQVFSGIERYSLSKFLKKGKENKESYT
jgi:hypothetical protein